MLDSTEPSGAWTVREPWSLGRWSNTQWSFPSRASAMASFWAAQKAAVRSSFSEVRMATAAMSLIVLGGHDSGNAPDQPARADR
jgi:hypothetical protein